MRFSRVSTRRQNEDLTLCYRAADRKSEGGRGERPSIGEGPIMDLSATILQETLTKVKSDKASGNAARRVRPRVGLRCALTIIPYANGACGARWPSGARSTQPSQTVQVARRSARWVTVGRNRKDAEAQRRREEENPQSNFFASLRLCASAVELVQGAGERP